MFFRQIYEGLNVPSLIRLLPQQQLQMFTRLYIHILSHILAVPQMEQAVIAENRTTETYHWGLDFTKLSHDSTELLAMTSILESIFHTE